MNAFSLEVPLRPTSHAADCWDQISKFGHFWKDDGDGPREAVFNLEHLGQFMDNWSLQPHPLWADWNHSVAECLARYDALALVADGVLVRQVSKADVPAPTAEQIRNPETGRIEDGLYAHRFEITAAGQEKLPNVFYISPLFVTNGKDEHGRDIGYELINIAFVNAPFLQGMAPLRMHRFPIPGVKMSEYLKRYGVGDEATPDQLHAAMKKYAEEVDGDAKKHKEEMSCFRRFADAVGGDEEFRKFADDEESMKRFRKFMEGGKPDDDDKDEDDGDKQEMTAMAKLLGVEPKLSAMREKVAEMRFTHAPKSEIAALKTQLAALEAKDKKREDAEREAAMLAFARRAITDRAWDPDDEAGLIAFYKASPDAAVKAVERNKKQKTWDRVIAMQRLTSGGAPIGKPEGEPLSLGGDDPAEVERRVDQAVKKIAEDENLPYPVAMTRLKGKHPELYTAYAAARQ